MECCLLGARVVHYCLRICVKRRDIGQLLRSSPPRMNCLMAWKCSLGRRKVAQNAALISSYVWWIQPRWQAGFVAELDRVVIFFAVILFDILSFGDLVYTWLISGSQRRYSSRKAVVTRTMVLWSILIRHFQTEFPLKFTFSSF
ncbi:hypothetical protein CA13_46650 [Planctomycetes bacterium CA13]|uniref:Uncharacterized protein n=1 Tax=Novipirellula herctigrandis TaxID=2527986 RepID=A0A5C5Z791_9BACT|nr:hypothetical protein CA13_46650 [Planctomycetes bacterium CA13]